MTAPLRRVVLPPPTRWGPVTACLAIGYRPPGLVYRPGSGRPWRLRSRTRLHIFGVAWRQRERNSPWEVIDLREAHARFRDRVKALQAPESAEALRLAISAWTWLKRQVAKQADRREREVGWVPAGLMGL